MEQSPATEHKTIEHTAQVQTQQPATGDIQEGQVYEPPPPPPVAPATSSD